MCGKSNIAVTKLQIRGTRRQGERTGSSFSMPREQLRLNFYLQPGAFFGNIVTVTVNGAGGIFLQGEKRMKDKTGILLVGIGGYGLTYVNGILGKMGGADWELKGVVDPHPEKCPRYEELIKLGIPVFGTLDEFYAKYRADLAVISSPIQYHTEQTVEALSRGSNVLCEKPAAATIQDVLKMREERDRSAKVAAIGYQWSFSDAVQRLKYDILSGKLGKPLRLKTIVLWPRDRNYYARGWAGRKKDAAGRWVLDSVAANATAHYLHNMFYVLGSAPDQSVSLEKITAETYRANPIENYDTAAIRARTDKGTELLFLVSHAVPAEAAKGPDFEYVFEDATVRFKNMPDKKASNIIAYFNNGTTINYGAPDEDAANKLWKTIEAIREGKPVPCGLEAASAHTICINCVQEAVPEPGEFRKELICFDEEKHITWVKGLAEDLNRCYDKWELPCEAGAAWARPGGEKQADGYTYFPGE